MSAPGRVQYEIQTWNNGRWAINEVMPTEESARMKADNLLAQKHIVGVRIVKESHFANDSRRESEVFKKMKEAEKDEDFSVNAVETAPVCEKVSDYYKTAARTTMNRLFTKYLEKMEVTPLEMLHHSASLKRAMNLDTMVPSGVDKVASLQAKLTGEDARKRRDAIFTAVDQLAKRAREAEGKQLPELKGSTLDAVLRQIDAKTADEDERAFMANFALTKVSINWQGLLGKITNILPMARSEKDARAIAMVDEMMSDILQAKTIIKDVIGVSKHMGDAVMRIFDLLEGKCQPTKFACIEVMELLNPLFAENKLPRSKAILYERIERDLKSAVRLTTSEQTSADKDFFNELLKRTVSDRGVLGGRPIAAGLAERWARMNNVGGATGRKKAIEGVCSLLESGKHKFIFLLSLYDEGAEAEVRGAIELHIRGLVNQLNSIQKIAPNARTEKARLQETAFIQKLVLESSLELKFKTPLADAFDKLVSDYIVSENVIQRLDDSRLPFRERTTRIVSFCGSGVLTVGKATTIARDAIVSYLRRKDFITELTADLATPAEKEKAIKEFYGLLAGTGFDVRG